MEVGVGNRALKWHSTYFYNVEGDSGRSEELQGQRYSFPLGSKDQNELCREALAPLPQPTKKSKRRFRFWNKSKGKKLKLDREREVEEITILPTLYYRNSKPEIVQEWLDRNFPNTPDQEMLFGKCYEKGNSPPGQVGPWWEPCCYDTLHASVVTADSWVYYEATQDHLHSDTD